jgi:tetratricopeptide (TPR) repeat protein
MIRTVSFFFVCALLSPLGAAAQDEATSTLDRVTELMPNQQAFLNLPEEKRKEFIDHLANSSRLFQQKRIFESMDELGKASLIFPDSPELFNLRGSCFVEMRSFDKALAEFQKAAQLSKNNASVEFNIAEVYFVMKEWQKALDHFESVLKKIPESNLSLSRLIEFKMLLCMKNVGRHDDALILSEKYDYLDDSPFYYYAKAALAYDQKKLQEAEEWLARASRIFRNMEIIAPWHDTLVEYGYIKSFYGEETVEPTE